MSNLKSRTGAAAYLLAVLLVLAMAGLRWLLAPALGQQVPFTTFLLAVLVVAWAGGLGPALCATLLSTLLGWFFFVPPVFSLQLLSRIDLIRVALFALVGVTASLLGESRLRAQERAEDAAADASRAADLARAEAARAEARGSRAEAAAVEAEEALNQQLEVEAALRTSEARFRTMAESSPLGIYLTDSAGDCLYTNPAYQHISGLTQGAGPGDRLEPSDSSARPGAGVS